MLIGKCCTATASVRCMTSGSGPSSIHLVNVTTQAEGHLVLSVFGVQSLSSDSPDEPQRHIIVN